MCKKTSISQINNTVIQNKKIIAVTKSPLTTKVPI